MANAGTHAHLSDAKAPSLVAELAALGRALRAMFDPYRPECHYMRGPGPRWRAKHDRVAAPEAAIASPAEQAREPVSAAVAAASA